MKYLTILLLLAACALRVEAPEKPIQINMNITIEHHVKLEIEKDVKSAMQQHKDIF